MANLSQLFGGNSFNPSKVEEVSTGFDPLPKGIYQINITDSEIKPMNSGNGTILVLKLVVTDGKYANRTLFDNLCVEHRTSPVAQGIAQTRLKQICESIKLKQLTDSVQLHSKPLQVKVDVELDQYQTERSGTAQYRNSIKEYLPVTNAVKQPEPAVMVATDDFEDVPF